MGKFFVKHGVSRPLMNRGAAVPFINLGDDTGYIELDPEKHSQLIADLSRTVGRLGLKHSTAEEVEELKKNGAVVRLRLDSMKPQLRVDGARIQSNRPAAPVVEVAADPLEIPKSIPKPRKRAKPLPTDSLAPQPQSAEPVAATIEQS